MASPGGGSAEPREDAVKHPSGDFEPGTRYGMIPPAQPRILVQRLLMGLCLILFSSLFFIGAVTVIGWLV